jgi:hypothetical protein
MTCGTEQTGTQACFEAAQKKRRIRNGMQAVAKLNALPLLSDTRSRPRASRQSLPLQSRDIPRATAAAMTKPASGSTSSAACRQSATPTYDIRPLLAASGRLRDGREIGTPGPLFVRTLPVKKLGKARNGALLREFELVGGD